MDFEQLMQIKVTSVSRRSERLFGAAAAVHVITGDEIRRLGAAGIPDVLRYVPGVQVAQVDSQTWAITARGLNRVNPNKLLVLIDGRTVYSTLFEGVFWDRTDVLLEDIDRIEVIRGPGGTLWGANAVNGVINIVTRHARSTVGTYLEAGGGIELKALAAARHGAAIGEAAWIRGYVKGHRHDGAELSDGQEQDEDWTFGQAGMRLDWEPSAASHLTLSGDAYRGRLERQATLFSFTPPLATVSQEAVDLEGQNLVLRWSRTSERSGFQVQTFFDRAQRTLDPVFGTLDVDTWDVEVQQRLDPAGPMSWIFGLDHRLLWDDLDERFAVTWTELSRTVRRTGGFVQADASLLGDSLQLTAGVKLEWNSYTGLETQPTLRVAWAPTPQRTLWGAVSRAVRTPSRQERDVELIAAVFDAPPVTALRLQGSRGMNAENLLAWEAGYRTELTPTAALDLVVFYHDYEDLQSFRELPPESSGGVVVLPFTFDNELEGTSYGLEAAARWQPAARLRLDLAYTLLRDDLDALRESPSPFLGEEVLERDEGNSPVHQASLRSFLDLGGAWRLDGGLRYVGRLETPQVPSYLTADLRVGWLPRPGFELSLAGRNLLDAPHAELGGQGGGDAVRPEIERSVFLTGRWSF